MTYRDPTEAQWRKGWRTNRDEAKRLAARAASRAIHGDLTGADSYWRQAKEAGVRAMSFALLENGHRLGRRAGAELRRKAK